MASRSMISSATTGTAITGSGVWHPAHVLTNAELCDAFNEFIRREIARTGRTDLKESTPEFIEKASGIKARYVEDKSGLLDPERMCPNIPDRPEEQLSVQAEYAVNAAKIALAQAGRTGEDVDLVVLGASNLQRLYPALAIEVQDAIGARGYGFDISLGCSAATGAAIMASQALRVGQATCALVVVPELTTGHMNWRERDSHFIFGDASVALVIERTERAHPGSWEILSTQMLSKWSNNIRNNQGYLTRCDPTTEHDVDKLFHQRGRSVFKDVVPMAAKFISDHVAAYGLQPSQVSRYWLHQANQSMNELIAKRVLGREATREEAPLILDEYGNTASAGSLIAFAKHQEDLATNAYGVMASFGAGYSLGSLLLRRT
ncbi:MAG: beta-ketoacyl-ACP synthase III [Proteobacteria bacterium]|nr:beta-ketoacyl-ACP synthase III [Pseudomonadota bacterium]